MHKISNREIIDVIKYSDSKVIIVEKLPVIEAGYKVQYYIIDLKTLEKEVITKSAYLLKKFGQAYKKITEVINNYADCEAVILKSREVFIMFPNGQCGLFDSDGNMLWNKTFSYNDRVVSSLAYDGEYLWCCCKDENCVIRYSTDNFKLDLRIGSKDASTFCAPHFLSSDEESIYVCCSDMRLRRIDKGNLTISDVTQSIPSLKRFYRFDSYSLICTLDGAYITEDE